MRAVDVLDDVAVLVLVGDLEGSALDGDLGVAVDATLRACHSHAATGDDPVAAA